MPRLKPETDYPNDWLAKPLVWVRNKLYIERLLYTPPKLPMGSTEAVVGLLLPLFRDLPHERIIALYGDASLRLIGARVLSEGSGAHVLMDAHAMVRGVAFTGASAVILAHNHPNQTLLPSPDDNRLTVKAAVLCHAMDAQLLDHLILPTTGQGYYSYAAAHHPALLVGE